MKRLILLSLVMVSCVLTAQTNRPDDRKVLVGPYVLKTAQGGSEVGSLSLKGMDVNADESTLRCNGSCEMKAPGILLKAGQIVYHSKTGAAEASDSVTIQLLPQSGTLAQ